MTNEKLTKERIESACASGPSDHDHAGSRIIRDAFPGFGIVVTPANPENPTGKVPPTDSKLFFVEVKVNGEIRRVVLGEYGAITIEQARELAKMIIAWAGLGEDVEMLGATAKQVVANLVDCPYRNKIRFREMVVESLIKVKMLGADSTD